MNSNDTFSIIDYAIFLSIIFISGLIGVYFIWKSRKNYNVDDYLLGNRKFKVFPVAMSQLASFTSAVSVLGFSHEMYRYGSMYLLMGLSYFITQPFAAHVFVPFFHRLKLTSVYEYLEFRFSRSVRVLASAIFCVQILLYMSVVLYAPSLAIHQVTGLSLWISIFLTGIVCTIYTSLGGIKAVVWTDTFQVIIMFTGILSIIIEGIRKVGGIHVVWNRAYETNRIDFFDFDPNPFKRHTFWSLIIGGFFTSLTVYGSNQASIQRYLILPTVKDAKISMYLNLIGTFSILLLSSLCGFVAFAYYFYCDPFLSKRIQKYDQILPLLAVDLLKNLPGLNGLFIACIYSASLSSVSSGLNAMATVCLHDFIEPLYIFKTKVKMHHKIATNILKIMSAAFGLLVVGLSFLCKYLGSTVVQAALSIFGIIGGPLLGVISLGIFVPYANQYGALFGLIISLIINFTLSITSLVFNKPEPSKPFTSFGCSINSTIFNIDELLSLNNTIKTDSIFNLTITKSINNQPFYFNILKLSYLWYSLLAVLNVFIIGSIISLLTGPTKKNTIDSTLLIDITKSFRKLSKSKKDNQIINNNNTSYTLIATKEINLEMK